MKAQGKKIHLRVITPENVKVDDKVDMVIMRCNTGYMGILPGHEPRRAVLDYGIMRILGGSGDERRLAVFGGFAEIKDDILTVVTGEANWPQDIDMDNEHTKREHLKRRLQEHTNDLEIQRDQALLRRLLVRMEIGAYHPFLEKDREK